MNYAKVSYHSFKVQYFFLTKGLRVMFFPKLKNTIVEVYMKSFSVYLKKIVYDNKN